MGPLPEPFSNDPTQWLFRGDIADSTSPLHVAAARLLGYRWPEQPDDPALDALEDADGILCLPALCGELPAAERLRDFLSKAYGAEWSADLLARLLAELAAAAGLWKNGCGRNVLSSIANCSTSGRSSGTCGTDSATVLQPC